LWDNRTHRSRLCLGVPDGPEFPLQSLDAFKELLDDPISRLQGL
jgi:hypothetical protein